MEEIEVLTRRLEREKKARKQAEAIAEQKTREIFLSNQELRQLTDHLEEKVSERTVELARMRDEAVAASQAKSQFLANMSHELRTPLNAIIGYSEILIEEAQDQGLEDFIGDTMKIQSAGKHLLGLINDILDLSKIEAGRMDMYLESFDLAGTVSDVIATVKPLVEKNGNVLEVICPDDIGVMHADLTKVRQSLFNLLSNASKFCSDGRITLTVARESDVDGKPMVSFSVADTGIGMSEEQLGRLFRAFTQADASTTRKYGGTGLGLAITRHFCQMMNGAITVTSRLEEGTTFTIRLPPFVAAGADLSNPAGDAAAPEADVPSSPACTSTILVIDDDPATRDLLRRHLTTDGYRVESAGNGKEGLRLARTLMPGAITLDVMMPGMDGWMVLTALKNDPVLASIPVVIVSMVDEKNMGYMLGAADYLNKPLDRKKLSDVLNKHCGQGRPFNVLLVEDDAATRELMRRTLEKSGADVIEAENGQAGLERLGETQPHLIVLDLMMPVMDGFQFLSELGRNPEWRAIPVVVATAKSLTPEDCQALNGSVQKILQKDAYTRTELLGEVSSVLRRHTSAQPG
jgi:signal transduction histidine kinase/DNA-binding response OmpR family regulator